MLIYGHTKYYKYPRDLISRFYRKYRILRKFNKNHEYVSLSMHSNIFTVANMWAI